MGQLGLLCHAVLDLMDVHLHRKFSSDFPPANAERPSGRSTPATRRFFSLPPQPSWLRAAPALGFLLAVCRLPLDGTKIRPNALLMPDSPDGHKTLINLTLSIGGRPLEAVVDVPAGAVRSVDLLPILQAMDDAVIDVAVDAVRQQGKTITCGAGCGACCRQLVPITETDAHYLAELIADMPPERRGHVERRFDEALDALDRAGMLPRLLGAAEIAARDQRRQLGLDYFDLKIPCPLLEDESCSVHLHRPMVCREYLVTTPAANCSAPLPQ